MNPQQSPHQEAAPVHIPVAAPQEAAAPTAKSPLDISFVPATSQGRSPESSPSIASSVSHKDSGTGSSLIERVNEWWKTLHPIDKFGGCLFSGLGVMEAGFLMLNPSGPTLLFHGGLLAVDVALAFRRFSGTRH